MTIPNLKAEKVAKGSKRAINLTNAVLRYKADKIMSVQSRHIRRGSRLRERAGSRLLDPVDQ